MSKTNVFQEGLYQNILDNAIEGILIAEIESKGFTYANRSICDMFGYEEEEMLALTVADIHPEDKLDDVIRIFEAQARGEIALAQSIPCQRKNGSVFFADINTSKTLINDVSYNVGFFSDVTEKIESENEFNASQRLLSTVFDAVTDIIGIQDLDHTVIRYNKAGYDFLSTTPEEIKGKKCFQLIGRDMPCDICATTEVLRTNQPARIERYVTEISRWIEIRAFPVHSTDGKLERVVETLRDITDLKNAEERMLQVERQLQQNAKLESLGVLAGGIAHDFNNLLGGIYGYLDIAHKASENEEVQKYLDATLKTMNRARSLTQQLLTFAKGGTPKKATEPLNQFIHDTVEFALSGSNILCSYAIEEQLWLCDYDRSQMAQVIDNIVINAQQAMPLGGKIELFAKNRTINRDEHAALPQGNYIEIAIQDSGTGIPHDIIHSIFDPFFTTKQKGSGLGLATSYSIVQKHDGIIVVESNPGKGTIFRIILPASDSVESKETASSSSKSTKTGKILIMDDEQVIREAMSCMLSNADFVVITTKDGTEAIEEFTQGLDGGNKFDMVILDLTVPGGMGGKAAVDEIRKLDKNIPVIVSSGYAEDPIVQNPVEYGFTDSLKKPFLIRDLMNMISKYL